MKALKTKKKVTLTLDIRLLEKLNEIKKKELINLSPLINKVMWLWIKENGY